jgi:uncharacterized protein YjiS (DUF1127 family)
MTTTRAAPRRRSRGAWGTAFGKALRAYQRHSDDRKQYRDLLGLDDRILRDLGITRDMVRHEMQKPFHWLR